MFQLPGVGLGPSHDSAFATIAELAIFGYFFTMRSCENTSTPKPGRTKVVCLLRLIFRDHRKRMIPHCHPGLSMAVYITVVFVSQKDHKKMDKRTQRRTTDAILCPVQRAALLVKCILHRVSNHSANTTKNTMHLQGAKLTLTGEFFRDRLRATCSTYGGKAEFGFAAHKIGTKSIQSGATMSLFLVNNSSDRIMLLGRWLSKAFLAYNRPKVLEWTNNMSMDMTQANSFLNIGNFDQTDSHTPREAKEWNQGLEPRRSTEVRLKNRGAPRPRKGPGRSTAEAEEWDRGSPPRPRNGTKQGRAPPRTGAKEWSRPRSGAKE
jgi:hypothetical protein